MRAFRGAHDDLDGREAGFGHHLHLLMQVDSRGPGIVGVAGNDQMPARFHKHFVETHGVLVALDASLAQLTLIDSSVALQSTLRGAREI